MDARLLKSILNEDTVDVTVTSPPYFDMKDYGHPDQIGFGQSYRDYLADLKAVFGHVFDVTKSTGTLWVVIDSFKKDGEVVPLPFDFAHELKSVGWKLQEIIIWAKDRTVPWTHKGQMRNVFEYILLFSKTDSYHFYIDRIKNFESLKQWWIRYPERYNPKGKTPDAIWNFDIPTQGSWGNGYIRHFCPLPEDLVGQILTLTTNEHDTVLDPFAGSGAVLSRAANMKRNYVGFELNCEYIKMFENYLKSTLRIKLEEYTKLSAGSLERDKFEELILNLRTLKYARVLYKAIGKIAPNNIQLIFAEPLPTLPTQKHKQRVVNYHIMIREHCDADFTKLLADVSAKPPLSKFGIEPLFSLHRRLPEFMRAITSQEAFVYTTQSTHRLKRRFTPTDLAGVKRDEVIFSNIQLEIDESLYG